MSNELKIGKFDRVRVETDGPDVRLTLPTNPAQCHWTDMQQIVAGLQVKIAEASHWESENMKGRPLDG